jgi:hypothetical protein
LDKKYIAALDIISKAKSELQEIVDRGAPTDTFEDHEAYYELQNLLDKLTDSKADLEYLNTPAKEGVLAEDKRNGIFYIRYDDGTDSYHFKSECAIEAYIDGEWFWGRVEHKTVDDKKGYYFFGHPDEPFLYDGMRVRKRNIV